MVDNGTIRKFDTGATRDTSQDKLDYDGCLSPQVLEAYARYMHKHRMQSDGTLRDAGNWKKGIPKDVYVKSLWRHFMALWKLHHGLEDESTMEDALCGVLFNAMGYLHEFKK